MNKQRRATLHLARTHLDKAKELISDAKFDEQYAFDNLPENLQNSERATQMEDAIQAMDDALASIADASGLVDEAAR